MHIQHFGDLVKRSSLENGKWSQWRIALLCFGGGGMIIIGTLVPWVSLFAGLQVYSGLVGMNGRLLFGGGVVTMLLSIRFFFLGGHRLRWGLGLLGFALLAFASWLLVQLVKTFNQLATDPLMVPRFGPGLVIVVIGALLVFATLFVNDE